MSGLAAKDLRAVLDVVYALGDDHSETQMHGHVLARLGDLVGCDSTAYNRVEHTTGRLLSRVVEPADRDISRLPGFDAAFGQCPAFAAGRSGRLMLGISTTLTDLADLPTLGRLPLYTDFYWPNGTHDYLMVIVQAHEQQTTLLKFNRARRGFSHRDRAVVDLVTPHLAQTVARRQHLASLTAAVRTLGRHSEQVEQALTRVSALTAREREVVEHLVSGVTDREIARSLAISQRTVHKHLERIYRKLGIGNRTSLIAAIHQAKQRQPAAAARRKP
jgi:DNA-binding CsgD family transcriptional regulator